MRPVQMIIRGLLLLRTAQASRTLRSSSSSSSSSGGASSGWINGIATNYGGPSEGMDPYSASYGTSDVSSSATGLDIHVHACMRCVG